MKFLFGIGMLFGIAGTVLPVIPGTPLVFGILLLAKISGYSQIGWWLVAIFGILTGIGMLFDYLIPAAVAKKLGGSRYGLLGLTIGFLVGIIFSPFGYFSLIVAPFFGALIGELIYDRKNRNRAVRAAAGSLIGYFLTLVYGLLVSFAMFGAFLLIDVF